MTLGLSACAALPPDEGLPFPATVPERLELGEVPFYPQDEYQCGPAALATALGAWGGNRTPRNLEQEVYLPGRRGSLQPEMLAATRRAGLVPYPLPPEMEALFREIAAGHPVVVLQNLGFDRLPQWHYAVVVGYDRPANEIVLRSGTERRLTMGMASFLRSWTRAGRWAFVPLPPDRLPATARETDFTAAAAGLERVAPAAARQAYQTAIAAWPGSLAARIGLGNAAYRLRDLTAARSAFQQAIVDHPESADAWNNLAQVLHESGRPDEARAAARRAVALGGDRQAIYEATLAAIETAAGR